MKRFQTLVLSLVASLLIASPALALDLNPFNNKAEPTESAAPVPATQTVKPSEAAVDANYERSKDGLKDAEARAEEARQRALQALKDSEAAQKELVKARQQVHQASPKELKRQAKAEADRLKAEQDDRINAEKERADLEKKQAEQAANPTAGDKGKSWNPTTWVGKEGEKTASIAQPAVLPASPSDWTDEMLETKAVQVATSRGNFTFELYPKDAPTTVRNFVKLVNAKFYDQYNMKFHRVIPGFVVQTGDPTGTGAGGSAERIPLEVKNKLTHDAKGVVSMARGPDPNSATSQFYVTLDKETSLDGKYAIFGRVISGLSTLDKISQGDMVYGVTLVEKAKVVRDSGSPEKKGMFGMGK